MRSSVHSSIDRTKDFNLTDNQPIFNIFSQSPVKRKGVFVKLRKRNSFLLTRFTSFKQSEVENIVKNSDKESNNSNKKFDQDKETKL